MNSNPPERTLPLVISISSMMNLLCASDEDRMRILSSSLSLACILGHDFGTEPEPSAASTSTRATVLTGSVVLRKNGVWIALPEMQFKVGSSDELIQFALDMWKGRYLIQYDPETGSRCIPPWSDESMTYIT